MHGMTYRDPGADHGSFWRRWSSKITVCLLILMAASSSVAYACADGYGCAVVRKTSDDFVALRREASASSSTVTKLKPYEILIVEVSDCDKGSWVSVESVPRLDGLWGNTNSHVTRGWIGRRLIEEAVCPFDPN